MSTTPEIQDRKRVDPPTSDLTADAMFDSLTGYDEIAVRKSFDANVVNLSQTDPLQFLRALVFVAERRGGLKDAAALKAAQTLTLGETADYFADDPEEVDPEDPASALGKGSPALATTPTS